MTYGLFFEGVKWNYEEESLEEQDRNQLITPAPYILLKPSPMKSLCENCYECPVYLTINRKGFIFDIKFPSSQSHIHWIRRGAALICSLND